MATTDASNLETGSNEKQDEKVMGANRAGSVEYPMSEDRLDLLAKQSSDAALDWKMHIVNNVSKNTRHATIPY
jgi:hypothetical protein